MSWEVKAFSPDDDFTNPLAVISDYVELIGGPVLCDVGAGSVTLDLDSRVMRSTLPGGAPATSLLAAGMLWRAYEDGEQRFEWIATRRNKKVLESDNRTRLVEVSGEGGASVLKRAKVLPPGTPHQTSFFWTFSGQPRMAAWLTLLQASQGRGTIPYVTALFTAATDSGGLAWADTPSGASSQPDYIPDLGADLLDLLNLSTGQDVEAVAPIRAEWVMWPGFQLDVRPIIGTHREDKVIFHDGGSTISRDQELDCEDVANYIIVRDVYGATSLATSAESIATYGQVELLQDQGNLTNQDLRAQAANTSLQILKDEKSSWTIVVKPDGDRRRVFRDYGIGDWVGVDEFDINTGESTVVPYRVMAITIHKTETEYACELTLQSRLDIKIRELQKSLTRILNTQQGGQLPDIPGPGSLPAPDLTSYTPYAFTPYNGGWRAAPISSWGGLGGGISMYIQPDEPTGASTGDLWYDTDATPGE